MSIFDYIYWRIVDTISFILNLTGVFSSKRMAVDLSSPKAVFVKDLIKSDKIVIFSKSYCPYCKLAKEVFDKMKEKYTAIELDGRDDGEEIQGILGEITGARTVPRVFIKENCVGGGSDVKTLYEKGDLQKLIAT
ncbi:glutaredoxin-C4 isoform X1 [Anoplophora glabripennis]|nr:glutaredoxin-C4 isoform X1 [Anoplophora glabripennis]